MKSLIIETSTDRGVIGCAENQQIIFFKEFDCGHNQSKLLIPYLEECLKYCRLQISDLSCIGIGVGPGSYTGIRVGVSVAQALAFANNLPLVEISSLMGFVPKDGREDYASIIDARIAGAYVQKQFNQPEVCELENLENWLGKTNYLVTPNSHSLEKKLKNIYPHNNWMWEERFPCMQTLVNNVQTAYDKKQTKLAGDLTLLYLRETYAERQKEQVDKQREKLKKM